MRVNFPDEKKDELIKWLVRNSRPEIQIGGQLEIQAKRLWEDCVRNGTPETVEILKGILTRQWDELEAWDIQLLGITRAWTIPSSP